MEVIVLIAADVTHAKNFINIDGDFWELPLLKNRVSKKNTYSGVCKTFQLFPRFCMTV